jgi:hypothetical protein
LPDRRARVRLRTLKRLERRSVRDGMHGAVGAIVASPNLFPEDISMKTAVRALLAAALVAAAQGARATPSTVVWTPATTYTQPYLVPHLTYDTYVSEKTGLANTYGLTLGVLPPSAVLQGEVGFDLFYPGLTTADGLQLNGKLTLPEGLAGAWQPALSVGIANAGFEEDVSDYHLLHATLSKATAIGTLGAGGYYGAGSEALWTGSGGVERAGFMASYVSPDIKLGLPGIDKLSVIADVSTGENWMGAVSGAVAVYFTPNVSLLTGPVFFLDTDLYDSTLGQDWMWTAQLDVDIPFMK